MKNRVMWVVVACLWTGAALSACDDADGEGKVSEGAPKYAAGSIFFGPDGSISYVSLLDALSVAGIDYTQAREFSGMADLHVLDGALFVAESETASVSKYGIEGRRLVKRGSLSFAAYGLTNLGFWLNKFIDADTAWVLNGTTEYVVWNPSTLQITGTVKLPQLAARDGLSLMPGYADRSSVAKNGRLYQALYWTDTSSYFEFTPDSRIAVFDIAAGALIELLEAPCPGLDFATEDGAGNIYFSGWVFAAGGAAALAQPATCVAKLEVASNSVSLLFDFKDIAGGREGGVFRMVGDEAVFAALHMDHVPQADRGDAGKVAYGAHWRYWRYDFATHEASVIEEIDWNAGGATSALIEGATYLLIPSADVSSTTVYKLGERPEKLFEMRGWGLRLFAL